MEAKDCWFALKSHVYVEFKEEKILLYDTLSGNYVETGEKKPVSLVSQLYEPQNLGVTLLTKEMWLESDVRLFVQDVLEKQMGDLTDVEKISNKPIRLIPILNLQKDVDKLKKREENAFLIGRDVMHYLLELNIYLNNTCSLNCPHCDSYYKQIRCCTKNNTNQELSIEEIENIFRQIQISAIGKINILGGNIFKYKNIAELQKIFDSFGELVHCYFHYENYESGVLFDSVKKELVVNFPVKEAVFEKTWQSIDKEKTTLHFIVENEIQYADFEKLIEMFNINKYVVYPISTGRNIRFFEDNIFLEKEDIFSRILSMREIFRNQKLNSNFFGSLFILPDGTVKANINTQSIGNVETDSILNLIHIEMLENTAWRKIRDSYPCNECVYQFICPAPSDYERVIDKSNFCHVKI